MSTVTTPKRPVAGGAPVAPPNVSPLTTVQNGLQLTWRSILKIKANPEEVFGLMLQPVMFVTLFVFVFGQAMMGDWQAYRDFLMPGIIAQSVIFATMGTGFSLSQDVEKGIFDRFRSLPIARSAPLIGAVLGDLVRYAITVVMVMLVGLAIGFRPEGGVTGVVAASALVLLFAFALCWMSAFVGMIVRTPMAVQSFAMILLFPLTFGSSTFVSPDDMPGWLAPIAANNPVTHVVDAMRGLMLGGDVAGPLTWTLVWTVLITAVFFPLAVWAYRRRT
ncbi:transport permease protein [Nocardiopsis terrae]|uniref:Transport permease protein n=1 Tax=Nocardiopsis terrae TaxID=372655 RepID=A0ABR9HFG2_9ACTN|nr:ABC transporter permease [Nocardiopsis terrae]MBE1457661.1 oleandomycin transport system permease protein [Nocardiopsis terrae]GHC84909.1 transport permease protein [Nocardiopsis terrae]